MPTRQPIAPLVTHVCQACGAEFQGKRHIKRKYCCKKCNDVGRVGKRMANYKGKYVSSQCQQCGANIENYPNAIKKFCNYACYARWQSENLSGENSYEWQGGPSAEFTCIQCGKEIRDYARMGRKFCDSQCKAAWQSVHRTGENNHMWLGGNGDHYYGINWLKQSRAARKRDGFRCQCCGISQAKLRRKLDVHHIIPFRTFGYSPGENDNYLQANILENLISVCNRCHQLAERGRVSLQLPLILD